MSEHNSIFMTIIDRVFPKRVDFFHLLTEQSFQVTRTVGVLVEFMETANPELGLEIRKDEHTADTVKAQNMHALNEAFSTPIDREDIYRAITDLDEIVNYCKSTVNEMDILALTPDHFTLEMAKLLKEGVDALANGFSKLGNNPASAEVDADAGRKAERKVEKLYRKALAELFQGGDFIHMFKRREIYRHLSNAADHLAHCANTLHDIVVKIC